MTGCGSLVAMAASSQAAKDEHSHHSREAKVTCQRECNCGMKGRARADAGRATIDFFQANDYSPVP